MGTEGAENSVEDEGTVVIEGEGQGEGDGTVEDDVVVTIGDVDETQQQEEQAAPEWVRELRKKNREDQKKIRELEERLSSVTEKKPDVLGAKPTLEGHDYDAEAFEAALERWYDQKRVVDEAKAKQDAEAKAADDAWKAKLASYGDAKSSLKVKDFEDAEVAVQEIMSTTQQGIILQGAENPAVVVYALGKNPAKAKEIAAITDPVKYAFAIAKLETQLKVTKRSAPPPEKTISGTGRISGSVDSQLERLRAEAEKTGDYTKVTQYKMQKRNTTK